MKKILTISILCMLFAVPTNAQNYIHKWKMGPLSWNDFVHRQEVDGHYSYLEYYMGYNYDSKEIDGVRISRPSADAYISAEFSWADTNYRTPELLRYNQCIFDLVEVYRRSLTSTLNSQLPYDHDQLLDNTMKRLGEDVTRLEANTQQGLNVPELERWERDIKHMLDSTSHIGSYKFTDAPFRWGMSLGLGYSYAGGQLRDYFSPGLGMSMNLDMGWKKHFVMTGMYIGGGRCRKDTIYTRKEGVFLLHTDDIVTLNLYAAYGFSAIDNGRFRLTPFVGYGLMGYYYTPDEGSSMGPGNGCFHFGLDFNKKFMNEISPDFFPSEDGMNAIHDMLTIDARLYATYNNFQKIVGSPQGFTINFQIGIGLMCGRARLE